MPRALEGVERALRLGRECTVTLREQLAPSTLASCFVNGRRVPRRFAARDVEGGLEEEPIPAGRGVVYFPPALETSQYSRNVLKFYKLSDTVLDAVRRHEGAGAARAPSRAPDFPFILDREQDEMIHAEYPESILLVGRSGTGKTSIAVGRMWACYEAFHLRSLGPAKDYQMAPTQGPAKEGDEEEEGRRPPVYRQAFITANAVLRAQVASSFEGMKNSSSLRSLPLRSWKEKGYPATFQEVPDECFPLFLTQTEFMQVASLPQIARLGTQTALRVLSACVRDSLVRRRIVDVSGTGHARSSHRPVTHMPAQINWLTQMSHVRGAAALVCG